MLNGRMHRLTTLVKRRTRTGFKRARASVIPAAQMALTATVAYAIASLLLGHEQPLFAATAALIALGFNREPRIRKVLEVAAGCTLGILVGDLLLLGFGSGLWQGAVVLFISILLARFLDSGATFTMQMGLQAVLVVLLPAPDGGPFTRSLDAIIGAGIALLVVFLTPRDPRSEPFAALSAVSKDMVEACQDAARALSSDTASHAWHALIVLRRNQTKVELLESSLPAAHELSTFSPTGRRHREQIDQLAESLPQIDLGIRSLRVLLRRLAAALDHGVFSAESRELLADFFIELADAITLLTSTLSANQAGKYRSMGIAREALAQLATRLSPEEFKLDTMEGKAQILLLRPLLVDLLRAAGTDREQAVAYLPKLA